MIGMPILWIKNSDTNWPVNSVKMTKKAFVGLQTEKKYSIYSDNVLITG